MVRILVFDVPIAQLFGLRVPMQYSLPLMLLVLEFLCTSDLDPLRGMRREQRPI